MRRHFHFVTYSLIFIFCLIRAEPTPEVNAVAAGQAGTSDAKAVSQQQPFLDAAAPVSAESLLQKIEETFRDEKKYMAEALTRAEKAEKETKEKKVKINEVWEDRNRYKDKSEARMKELEAARQELEQLNRQIEENDLSLATLNRKLVDARMTAVAWTMLEEDRITHRRSSPSSFLTYEQARTTLTPEALEAYLLQRIKTFYKFQPDLKAISEGHSKLLSPAMETAYLQNRMLFHPRNVAPQYEFSWRFVLAPLIISGLWVRWSAAILMLALVIGVALRKVMAIMEMASTMTSVTGAKRLAQQAITEHMIVDTEKGPDDNIASGQSSPAVVDERSSGGIRHVLSRLFFAVPSTGKSE